MESKRPVVVIVGAGFGGLATVSALKDEAVDIVLIDQRNHHLFQPLLYQVATAWLSPADIAAPVRSVFSKQKNLSVVLGKVIDVDVVTRSVRIDNGARQSNLDYDFLVLATGARHDYFGNHQWTYAVFCHTLYLPHFLFIGQLKMDILTVWLTFPSLLS